MALDLHQLAEQVTGMASRLKAEDEGWRRRLHAALDILGQQSGRWQDLERKRRASQGTVTFLAPGLREALAEAHEPPPLPPELTVLASDGSHIDVDRHSTVRCYLINIGTVLLRYGPHPDARLHSQPTLSLPQDLTIADPQGGGGEPVDGVVLAARRTVEECRALARLAPGTPRPTLALLDGSLILWGLASREFEAVRSFVREELLGNGLLPALDDLSQQEGLALASYISLPGGTEVVNALRLALCPTEVANCDRCRGREKRECEALAGVLDRHLFQEWLCPGQRSALFLSPSRIIQRHYGRHAVSFFYLRLEEEVARVELPLWVAERGLLELAHALILEQCRLGQGYPLALTEAHERAVLTPADREAFWNLVAQELDRQRLGSGFSAKRQSKRRRWL